MSSAPPINRSMTPLEWAMLLGLSVLWGGSFFFNGVLVRELPAFTIVLLRVAIAAAALRGWMAARGIAMPRGARAWGAMAAMGLLNNAVPLTLIVEGQRHIPSGLAAILNATTPLFGVVVAHFATADEKMTGRRLVGVLVGVAGVAAMIGAEALRTVGADLPSQLAVLGAAMSYALAGAFGRRFRAMGIAPVAVATGQSATAALMLAPLALAVDRPWTLHAPGATAVAAMLALALASTAFAYVVYFRILSTAGTVNALLVTQLVPVTALLLGALALGEAPHASQLVGMATIALGLAIVDGRPLRLLRTAAA
ncbi:MAG: DMT family transporter [Hyphomicrobiales bacterium]|nr:DMT family transporter [Hyphomicrobiales bacterium]